MFADLHNHNHSRVYAWLRPWREKHERKGRYHPWTIVASNMKARRKARMASAYGQCDLVKLWNGKVRLTFNALYPIEKGFFKSNFLKKKQSFKSALISLAAHHDLPLRDLLQGVVMRMPQSMINFIQSNAYDYWNWLNEEYEFALSRNGQLTRNEIHTPGAIRSLFESKRKRRRKYPELLDASGIYEIPKNKQDLNRLLRQDKIVMVLTIEGAHALGTDHGNLNNWKAKVDHIKNNWQHPVFFMTLAHHFDNKLCGHAHSFPEISKHLLDQSTNLNGSFTNAGWVIIRKLLALDNNNDPAPAESYRILIDVKHMSAKSRKEYYDEIVRPCLQKGDQIPVIASHCGYSGRRTLAELMQFQGDEVDDYFPVPNFYGWNINVCAEDIQMVFKTEGLFGLSFDQRIVGVPTRMKEVGERNGVTSLWENVKEVVRIIYDDPNIPQEEKGKIWNCLSLGSDFEGYIDPINKYLSSCNYSDFKKDLIELIDDERNKAPGQSLLGLNSKAEVETAVGKLCYTNAMEFVKRWYP